MKHLPLVIAAILAVALVPCASAATHTVGAGCGGTFTTIQAAVNAATPGDVVVVRPCGVYTNGFIVSNKANIQIVGALGATPGLVGAYPVGDGINPFTTPQIFDNGATCVHIEDSRDISIVGLALESCIDNGFRIERSRRITIQGNSLYNAGADGMAVVDSRHVSITGNYLSGALGAGIRVFPGTNRFVTIQNNRVLFNSDVGIQAQSNRVDILNNEVFGNGGTGILVQNGRSKVSRNTVTGNGSGVWPQIDYNSLFPNTCLVGNETNGGIQPPAGGCRSDNN